MAISDWADSTVSKLKMIEDQSASPLISADTLYGVPGVLPLTLSKYPMFNAGVEPLFLSAYLVVQPADTPV